MVSLGNAKTFTAPTRMIGLSDDPWATPRAIDALQAGFVATPVDRVEIQPASVGLREIGHMGFFRARNEACWHFVTDFLAMRSIA
jgi:predicted alpha/beta hydrolase